MSDYVDHMHAERRRLIGTLARHCPQCDRSVRVSEPYAFGGRDRIRLTLACGHLVIR